MKLFSEEGTRGLDIGIYTPWLLIYHRITDHCLGLITVHTPPSIVDKPKQWKLGKNPGIEPVTPHATQAHDTTMLVNGVFIKGTVNVISSDSQCKGGNARFTKVPLKPLTDQ